MHDVKTLLGVVCCWLARRRPVFLALPMSSNMLSGCLKKEVKQIYLPINFTVLFMTNSFFFPWLFLPFCSVRWDKNLGKYSLFVYVFQNRKGWLDWVRVICVTHTNFIHSDQFTFSIVVYQSEQYLHCRLGRYYSRRDPLQVQGEAAAKLAEDLKIIVCNVKEGKMNPGSMYIMPHFNHTDSKKKIHSSIWQPFCILIMPHINISTKQQVNPCFMSIIPCFKATI